ncbi:MAG TPA: AAA family ATPase, partial [Pirellulales bacterium]|nr:AAA family ATPase [Pirellulales bacterium]
MPDSPGPVASPQAPIEFRCPNCQKLLRIAAAAAGKQAQCPECRTAMIVPQPATSQEPALQLAPIDGFGLSGNSTATHSPSTPVASPPLASGQNPMPPVQSPDSPAATVSSPLAMPSGSPSLQPQPVSIGHLEYATPSAQTSATKALFDRITAEVRKVYIGQDELVLGTLVALFSSGHVLIESVPGLGKTLFVRTLGRVLGCRFGRIQFTADLMPSDITGAPIF